ncbi:MAG: hypothetical protein GX621_02440, partial [Pirellulaceae bacterium]|nr:hypothetical protein [Pirellulaceae bacterium]
MQSLLSSVFHAFGSLASVVVLVGMSATLLLAEPIDTCMNWLVDPPVGIDSCECTDECPPSCYFDNGEAGDATTCNPILLRRGSVTERVTDLSIPGPVFGWRHTRTYDSSLKTGVPGTGGEQYASENGQRWMGGPHSLYIKQNGNNIDVFTSASHKLTFEPAGGNVFVPSAPFGGLDATLVRAHADTSNEVYKLTINAKGDVYIFHGFHDDPFEPEESVPLKDRGWLKERTNREYQAFGEDQNGDSIKPGIRYLYNSRGLVETVITADPQGYYISYQHSTTSGTIDLLKSILVYNGAPGSPGVMMIARVDYTYVDDNPSYYAKCGSTEDLIQVKVAWRATSSPAIVRYTQYRYFKDADSDGNNHQLKMVFEPDAVERAATGNSLASPASLLALNDAAVDAYVTRKFTYYTDDLTTSDAEVTTPWGDNNLDSFYAGGNAAEVDEYDGDTRIGRVKTETILGSCGCGGGSGSSGVTKTYFYLDINGGPSQNPASWDRDDVVHLVVEDTEDSEGTPVTRTIYGLNAMGNQLRKAVVANPNDAQNLAAWCTSIKLAANQKVAERRSPSAHAVATNADLTDFLDPTGNGGDNDANTLAASGFVELRDYSGPLQTAKRIKNLATSDAYYVWSRTYVDSQDPVKQRLVACHYDYPEPVTAVGDNSRVATDYSYEYWPDTSVVKKATVTRPDTSSQNGPATRPSEEQYFDKVGRLRWTKDGDGYVNYYSYHPTNGQRAYVVRDADPDGMPTSADDNSMKWVLSTDQSESGHKPTRSGTAAAVEQVAKTEYDMMARAMKQTIEDGVTGTDLTASYTRYNADATIRFPHWNGQSEKCLLPIQVSELDDAGTVTGTYAVVGTQAESDGVDNLKLKTSTSQDAHYVRMSKNVHDQQTGQLTATRVYHLIPTSGDGAKDTNYAETLFGYDTMGRRNRVVSPVGTITRTVHDA